MSELLPRKGNEERFLLENLREFIADSTGNSSAPLVRSF
jgi:hypothetical protein